MKTSGGAVYSSLAPYPSTSPPPHLPLHHLPSSCQRSSSSSSQCCSCSSQLSAAKLSLKERLKQAARGHSPTVRQVIFLLSLLLLLPLSFSPSLRFFPSLSLSLPMFFFLFRFFFPCSFVPSWGGCPVGGFWLVISLSVCTPR